MMAQNYIVIGNLTDLFHIKDLNTVISVLNPRTKRICRLSHFINTEIFDMFTLDPS